MNISGNNLVIYKDTNVEKYSMKQFKITGDKIVALNGKPVGDLLGEFGNPNFLVADNKAVTVSRMVAVSSKDTVIVLPNNFEEIISKSLKGDMPFFAPRYQFEVKTAVSGGSAYKAGVVEGDKIIVLNQYSKPRN